MLANILKPAENIELLKRIKTENPKVGMVTPCMNHHYIDALLQYKMFKEANTHIKYHRGGMLEENADYFWELFDPEDKYLSPCGSRIFNSYCHAWSCTVHHHTSYANIIETSAIMLLKQTNS